MVALSMCVSHWYGPIGVTRLFGAYFVMFALWGIREPELEVRVGHRPVGKLTGAKKAFALVPAAAIGLAMLAYAPAITCSSLKYADFCN